MEQYIVFVSNQQDFAIDISKIERIIEYQEPKVLPETSDYLLGVIQYNSQVIPIIDLSSRLYGEGSSHSIDTKIIVVIWKDKLIGLLVDNILGIQEFTDDQYEESNKDLDILRKYVSGFIKVEENIIIILDVDKIFSLKQEDELLSIPEDEASLEDE